ncbi:MAG TPA: hypothetical protein EYN67_06645 [Flavobacteriales bacterium]|nr:hypothetical protein [Flavobacteriales bacterium]
MDRNYSEIFKDLNQILTKIKGLGLLGYEDKFAMSLSFGHGVNRRSGYINIHVFEKVFTDIVSKFNLASKVEFCNSSGSSGHHVELYLEEYDIMLTSILPFKEKPEDLKTEYFGVSNV